MGTIRGNGIWSPGTTDPGERHTLAAILASSGSNAIGGQGSGARSARLFGAANQTEEDAVLALVEPFLGDRVERHDTGTIRTWDGIRWRITSTRKGIPYTPAWVGTSFINIGNGTHDFRYWIEGSKVTVRGVFTFGSTSSVGVSSGVYAPTPPELGALSTGAPIIPIRDTRQRDRGSSGTALALIGSNRYIGRIDVRNTSGPTARAWIMFRINASGGYTDMSNSVPTTWTTGSALAVEFTYDLP